MSHVLGTTAALAALGFVLWLSGRLLLAGELGRWRDLASFCLGLAYWIAGLFVLAAAGFLNRSGLALVTLPLLLAAFRRRREWRLPKPRRPGLVDLVCGAGLAAVLAATSWLTLSPQVLFDADVYHLTLPRLYLDHGGFHAVPMSVYSNWPLATELLYAAAMLVDDYVLAKAVHFGFGLLTIHALFVGLRREDRTAPWLATAFFLANGVVAFELRVAYVDLAHAFFFLAAFLFMHRALEDDGERARAFLLLSGLACALMAGVKVTGIVSAGVIGVLGLSAPDVRRQLLRRFALPVAAGWTPWLLKAAWYTGNPFYPFLHPWLGGPDWSARLTAQLTDWQSSIGMGRAPLDYLLLPLRVILQGGRGYDRFDGEIGVFWIAVVPLALLFGRRSVLARRALAVSALSFIAWAASSQQMRLLIPVLPLLAVAGALAVTDLIERLSWRRAARGLALALAAVLVATVHAPSMAGGYRNLRAFLAAEGDLEATVVPEPHRFINEQLPAGARLLFLNTNLGFFCRREYFADSFFEASQISDWLGDAETAAEVAGRLRERGVTHLLLDARPRTAYPPSLVRLLGDRAWVRTLFRSSNQRFLVMELAQP